MPPRKGIVKSGNAGNSSKASKPDESAAKPVNEGEKPLFPPGSKYPLSLLHERYFELIFKIAVVSDLVVVVRRMAGTNQ
jgi:hypothetical protein